MAQNPIQWNPMLNAYNITKHHMGSGALGEEVSFARKRKGDVVLYVRGVNAQCPKAALHNLFSKTGKVTKCEFGKTRNDMETRIAFVSYKTQVEAEKAIEEFNDFVFANCKLSVCVALSDEEKQRRRAEQKACLYTGMPEGASEGIYSPWTETCTSTNPQKSSPLYKTVVHESPDPSKGTLWGPEDDFSDEDVGGTRTASTYGHQRHDIKADSPLNHNNPDMELFSYSSPGPLKVGCLTEVYVITDLFRTPVLFPCHVKHPSKITIHERYHQRQLHPFQEFQTGDLVAALYEGEYYRAKIISPVRPGEDVKVSFIDFGNQDYVSPSTLHILDVDDAQSPSALIKVSIEGTDDSMVEEYFHKFSKLIADDNVLKINGMVVRHDDERDVYVIRMGNLSFGVEQTTSSSSVEPNSTPSSLSQSKSSSSQTTADSDTHAAQTTKSLQSRSAGNSSSPTKSVYHDGGHDSVVDDSVFEFSRFMNKITVSMVLEAYQTNLCVARPVDLMEEVELMDEWVSLYAESAERVNTIENGNIVIAPYKDRFYRGLVKNVVQNEAHIFFMDYGNESVIPISLLKRFKDDDSGIGILAKSAFAIPCRIAGITGKNGGIFSEESFQMIVQILSNVRVALRGLSVVHDDVFDGDVLLVQMATESFPCVASYLIEKEIVNKLDEAVLSPTKAKKRCPDLKEIGVNAKLKASGEWMDLIALHFESPANFTVISEDDVNCLSKMSDQLEAEYLDKEKEYIFREDNLSVGMVLIAFSKQYQSFFRGCVRCIYIEEESADILFIDLGDFEKIPFCNMFFIKEKFRRMHQLSISCCLEDAFTNECSSEFTEEMAGIFDSANAATRRVKIKIIRSERYADPSLPHKAIVAMKVYDGAREFKDVKELKVKYPSKDSRDPKEVLRNSNELQRTSTKKSPPVVTENACYHPDLMSRLNWIEKGVDEVNKKIELLQEAYKIIDSL